VLFSFRWTENGKGSEKAGSHGDALQRGAPVPGRSNAQGLERFNYSYAPRMKCIAAPEDGRTPGKPGKF
jgi:hypothetical protein